MAAAALAVFALGLWRDEGAVPYGWVDALIGAVALSVLAAAVVLLARRVRRAHRDSRAQGERALEDERRRLGAQRMALLANVAAGVAHEVNSPLAVIRSNVAFVRGELQRAGTPDVELEQVFEETLASLARIQQVIAELREFARDDAGDVEPCAAGGLLREALESFRSKLPQGVRLGSELTKAPAWVDVSPRRFVQAVTQLLENAAQALQAGSSPSPWIGVRSVVSDGRLQVMVEDSGPGIPAAELPHVFEPFFTTKDPGKGLGLGLALAQELAHRAAGVVYAENRAEGGARFVLELPLASRG